MKGEAIMEMNELTLHKRKSYAADSSNKLARLSLKSCGKILLIILLSIVLTACSNAKENSEHLIESQRVIEERFPIFLHLEYLYSLEVDFIHTYRGDIEGEFTCFNTYSWYAWPQYTFEDVREAVMRDYQIELPEYIYVDLDSENFIAISIGRRLSDVYYFEDRWNHKFPGSRNAAPIFEDEYHHRTVFIYVGSPLPTGGFVASWWSPYNSTQFNDFNNIPFNVWVFPPAVLNRLAEPIEAYVSVEEAYLRMYPTRNSRVEGRLRAGDNVIIIEYTNDGEEIEGNSRWYFVERANGPSRFIHSAYILYISE